MKKLTGIACALLGVLVLSVFFSARGKAAVQLINSLAQLVENVDEPGRTRVQVTANYPAAPVAVATLAPIGLYTVPAQHRLVVEEVSGQCITAKSFTSATLFTYVNGKQSQFTFAPTTEAGNAGQANSQYFTSRMTAYSDPGTTVLIAFQDHRALNTSWQCTASLAGHLVDIGVGLVAPE
jgi:hypothetical protein